MSIPALHSETEQLFIMAETAHCKTLCVTACHAKAGVTSLAMAIAERYLLAGYKTLLLDLNLHRPSFSPVDQHSLSGDITLISEKNSNRCFQGLCCNLDTASLLEMRKGVFLNQQLEIWLKEYQRIVVDTSPLLQQNRGNIPANLVAAACDNTLLSVSAGRTTKPEIQKALKLLNLGDINLLGTVLNQRLQPTLSQEIQREINRFSWLPNHWLSWLKSHVKDNGFINMQS
ncbi:chromosome partitioning ATPase [Vibrio sp. MACH09]|nr:chromosome partitioning ATPase [Vibrio sp. MACH09]